MKKIIAMVIVVVMVMAFASTAFAASGNLYYQRVSGGPSQRIAMGIREEPNSMDLRVDSISWNGQSNFNIRGYDANNGGTCTYMVGITGTGYFKATYTTSANAVTMMASIRSGSMYDYLEFSGSYLI